MPLDELVGSQPLSVGKALRISQGRLGIRATRS